jgi:hypothetical protein
LDELMNIRRAHIRIRPSIRIAPWALLASALALVALTASCGGSSSAAPTATSAATTTVSSTPGSAPTSEPTAQAMIDNALLDTPDLPSGWQQAFAGASSIDLTLNLCNQHIDDSGYVAHGQTALTDSQNALLERIAVYPAARAAEVVRTARAALGACSQWSANRNGQSLTFRSTALPFPTLGDETLAFTMSAFGPGNAAAGSQTYVVVRQGATIMTLSYLTTGTVDAAAVQNLVKGAFSKLQKAQSGPTS